MPCKVYRRNESGNDPFLQAWLISHCISPKPNDQVHASRLREVGSHLGRLPPAMYVIAWLCTTERLGFSTDILSCPAHADYGKLKDALQQGLVTEADIDQALIRSLAVRFRLGMFDPPAEVPFSAISPDVIGSPEHVEAAVEAARQSEPCPAMGPVTAGRCKWPLFCDPPCHSCKTEQAISIGAP